MSDEATVKNEAPPFKLTVAGEEFSQEEAKGLESIIFEDHVDMIGICDITFQGEGETAWDTFELGSDVELTLGEEGKKLFVGYIAGLRHIFKGGKDLLVIQAMDPLCKLAASRVTKVYEEQTDSDVVSSIISDAGLSSGTVDSTSATHDYIFQRNESNLHFIRRLAARNNYLVLANEGKIDFVSTQFSDPSKEILKEDLVSLDYSFSTRSIPEKITCYGWDYVAKEKVEGTAQKSDVPEIGGGDNVLGNTGQIWEGESYISDVWVSSQDGAKEVASSELNRLARNFLRGRATIPGNGEYHAGVKVKFKEHRDGFNPEGYVISSRHRIYVAGGYTTEIVFCSNTYPGDA